MKILVQSLPEKLVMSAVNPGRWDASPRLSHFVIHHNPALMPPDRIAVAASLLFGDTFGGVVQFPSTINIVTANAIRRFCRPADIYFTEIDEGPKPLDQFDNLLLVERSLEPSLQGSSRFTERTAVLIPAHEYRGMVAWHRGIAVATNATLFDETTTRGLSPKGSLAAGVLLAAEYESSTLGFVNAGSCTIDTEWLHQAADLLDAVGLGLTVLG